VRAMPRLNISKFSARRRNLGFASFGTRAAVEAAERHREAVRNNDKKEGTESWTKVKFDRQIIAIARSKALSASTPTILTFIDLAERKA
jgi:hypothetical protein